MISLLKSRMCVLKGNINKVKIYRDILQDRIGSGESEIQSLEYSSGLQQKSSEVFKGWLEDLLESNVNSIADLATSGLKHIIHDQDLTFSIKQELKRNRLSMRFVMEEGEAEGDPLFSFGGGAVLIISLILRLAIMSRMKMGNLLLLDESLFALADHYVPSAGDFMKQLSERTGINILMITHNSEFLHHAHISYEGQKKDSLRLRRLVS